LSEARGGVAVSEQRAVSAMAHAVRLLRTEVCRYTTQRAHEVARFSAAAPRRLRWPVRCPQQRERHRSLALALPEPASPSFSKMNGTSTPVASLDLRVLS